MKLSDYVAQYLEENQIDHVFGIIGAGNAHLYDSITHRGFTKIICTHHEQAAIMAMIAYYRMTGKKSAVLLTTGAGSTNGVTGVVSAWMDSIPAVIIAGNENSKFTTPENKLRIWGVQGYDSVAMVEKVTKYASRVSEAGQIFEKLNSAFEVATSGRMGPTWLEIPMNIQSTTIDLPKSNKEKTSTPKVVDIKKEMAQLQDLISRSKRPLLWLGHGIRLSGAADKVEAFVNQLKIPALVSWAGMDMLPADHTYNFGSAGVYGQRAANFVLQNCDLLITIGTRLAIPQVGYDLSEFVRDAKLVVNDIDDMEARKHGAKVTLPVVCDASLFMESMSDMKVTQDLTEWHSYCNKMKKAYPRVGKEHDDKNGYINSYRFMQKLSDKLADDVAIVTDMGTALLSGHQVLALKGKQRLVTSTGLGEMGFGLPAAIGSAFGVDNKKVICLNCDGGMMLNLQELQTMVHHKLPIKLFIFNNDGYLMIKHTQKALFNGRYSGTNADSGVTCPDYEKLSKAFDLKYYSIKTWKDFDGQIDEALNSPEACVIEVFMDPEQPLVPKLSLAVQADGSLISPPLEDLSPLIPREELKSAMLVGVHDKSLKLVP